MSETNERKPMKRATRLAIAVLPLVAVGSGCTAAQHAAWENYVRPDQRTVVCYIDQPCDSQAGDTLNMVLAVDADDDWEAAVDQCDRMGGRELVLYRSDPTKVGYMFTEEWVCERVDF